MDETPVLPHRDKLLRHRRLALAVADVNWFTTEHLFREVSPERAETLLIKCVDYNNAWRSGRPPWAWGRPLSLDAPGRWGRDLVLPSGWMKSFPRLGMRPIARAIHRWRDRHAADECLTLVMTYPHYLYLRDLVRPERLVYFNVDDYAQYWPRHAREVNRLELRAVRDADLTLCVSVVRAETLRRAVPEAADRIHHLPHGTPSSAHSPAPCHRPAPPPPALAALPRPLLGYVGTMEDRVDWPLLIRLAEAMPEASVVLVGRVDDRGSERGWRADRARCLVLPNVHGIGWQPQEMIPGLNRSFDVGLIPYRVDHPFNRVCCPTKIMDTMATGRPIVSTKLPETSLYIDLFDVARDTEEFIAAVQRIVAGGSDDGRAGARHEWAADHTCRRVVDRLLDWIPGRTSD